MSENTEFSSKLGLIAATVGSAIGLGNIWRFPAEVQSNGGAAFLLVYIICLFVLGIPVMLAEFSIGRGGRGDAVSSFTNLVPGTRWRGVGALAILATYLIMAFYMVVTGWTLEYLWFSITGELYQGATASNASEVFGARMNDYLHTDAAPIIASCLVIFINIGVLLGGVQKGIEKLSNLLMPVLFIILIGLCCVSLSLPEASEGIKFFLSPDFSAINAEVLVSGLGQAFFSLSLGMGILITYSAYYPAQTRLTQTSVIVSLVSLFVSVLMGFIIFPAVTSFGLGGESLAGETLVFATLPEVFLRLPATRIISALFFLLLFVAALTSTVSTGEVAVAYLRDHFKMKRTRAVLISLLPLTLCSAVCALSLGSMPQLQIMGKSIFGFLDNITTQFMLPLAALGGCLFIGWRAPRSILMGQLTNHGTLKAGFAGIAVWLIRIVAPAGIIIVLLWPVLKDLFR